MAMPTKKSMKAVFDCSADEPGELSFKEGDILVDVEESGEEGWYIGRIQHTSETGLFPYNYVVELPSQKKEEPLSKFPPIDAFEAAMSPSSAKTSFSKSNTSNWAISPPTSAAKPKLSSTAPSSSSNSNVGLGIRVYGSNNNNNNTFEKPQLKPIGSIKSMDATSPTRSRSYSTSAVLNASEKEPMQTEKTLRPSQLLNGKGTKSALELALSKGSPKSLPSANVKSSSNNALSTSMGGSSAGGIALPGMSNIKLNNTHDAVEEEEDGFQMVKPSQLRSRQQQQVTPIRPIVSQSSSFTSTPSWKKTPDTKVFTNTITASPSSLSSASSSPRPTSGSKLDAAPTTSTPMPRLPSRPVSTASRRSRNSRNSSSSLKSSPSASSKTTPTVANANLPPVRETTEKSNPTPPILKPKPQMTTAAAAAATTTTTATHATTQPNLPPRPKLRSTSNPPPIQPKPAMSSIEILLSKNNTNKNESAVSTTTTAPSKSTTPPPRNAATKPVLSSTNKKPTHLSSRPSLDGWQSLDNAKEDVNIKPSTLLKNNRARSATNPVSSSTAPEWMSSLNKQPKPSIATAKPVLYERATSPVAHPVSRSPAPMAAAVIEPASATTSTKKNPPPPPPSRPPKSQNNSKQRYEVLFDSIHDDGYVDGETAHFVWLKSRLSNEDLARIWKECDPDHKGLLDKHAFIDGMSKIDELLSLKQQQQAV